MRSKFLLFLLLAIQSQTISFAIQHELTDTEGKTIHAELVYLKGENLYLIREDGKHFTVPIDRFSNESQEIIRTWQEKRSRLGPLITNGEKLRVSVSYNKEIEESESITLFNPSVQILNQDIQQSYQEVKGTLIFIGKRLDTPSFRQVLNRQEFTLDLPRKSSEKWEGDPFQIHNNSDNDPYGYSVDGYILILQNYEGEIIYEHASKAEWTRLSEKALSLEEFYDYDKTLSKKMEPVIY
ncbi:hypothetical protein MLD52_10835 [Puniceicoccaceae bacterium K14]|nr:hypothetical protein [Puniceicoccaceae bacterium K14]